MLKPARFLALIALPTLVAGCEANQLYLAYQTNVGVNASVKPEMTEGSLVIGYRRDFAAVVPKSVPVPNGVPGERDAMAALVCSDLQVEGIWLTRYVEYVATGPAAKKFAQKIAQPGQQPDNFFDCYKATPTSTKPGGQS